MLASSGPLLSPPVAARFAGGRGQHPYVRLSAEALRATRPMRAVLASTQQEWDTSFEAMRRVHRALLAL